jgi:hypothetical protein
MNKSLIFISHIQEEKELAVALKDLIEKNFLGMIDVFVSSDDKCLSLGQKWLDSITHSLKSCSIEIILCSPKSVSKPWINFEAGSGWIRDIPVIPLCHSGMEPTKLPPPLNLLQATKASEISGLKLILPVLADAIGSDTPVVDFSNFIQKVKEFEKVYTFWDECNEKFSKLNSINSEIINGLKNGSTIKIELTESEMRFVESLMQFFTPNNILQFKGGVGDIKWKTSGVFYDCEIIPMLDLFKIIKDPHFRIQEYI